MKILHISKSDSGGAGIAALRLHKAMLSMGLDSKFLCLNRKNSNEPTVVKYHDSIARKLYRASRFPLNKYVQHKKILEKLQGNYEAFSFIESDYFIHNHDLIKDADIINLHFIHGFIDLKSFLLKVKKPIFWTMHDMNPWQGGFHYENDLKVNIARFGNIEEKLLFTKEEIYSLCSNLNLVALNKSYLKISSGSRLLASKKHFFIPNTIDFSVFNIQDKNKSRDYFQLPQDKTIILFASHSLLNHRKGGDLALEVYKKNKNKDIVFCQVGEGAPAENENQVISIDPIWEEKKMSKLFSAVDVVIIPSREDNLPNVMVESLSCGTPVIATPVGGCLDVIKPFENGFLTNNISSQAILDSVNLFIKNKNTFNRVKIRERAKKMFAPKIIIQKYLNAYGDSQT